MAGISARSTVFKITDSGSTLRDISPYLTSCSFPRESGTEESQTFGDSAKERIVTLTDASISIEGFWDPAAAPAPDVVLAGLVGNAATAFEYGPAGSTGGYVKYTGSAVLVSYEPKGEVGGLIQFSAEFQVSGAITRTTW